MMMVQGSVENETDIGAAYRRDGVCVLKDVVPAVELDTVHQEIAELFAAQVRALGLTDSGGELRHAFRQNALAVLQADVRRYIAAARVTQDLPSVHRLLTSERIVRSARSLGIGFPLISTKASVHIMDDDLRVPNGYHRSPPHQDWRSIQGSLDNVVFWIPLTPVRGSSGVEVVRGSHRRGLLNTVDHIMTPSVSDPEITDDMFEHIDMEPGDVLAFSAFMVHRTSERSDGLARIALSTRFNNALEATYVERGFPSPYRYSYQLDLITPDFPSAEQVLNALGARDAESL
jgi:phytanoyl-CoA hydroxylase